MLVSRIIAVSLPALVLLSSLGYAQDRRTLENQLPKPVASGELRPTGRYPGSTRMSVAIGLPLGDTDGLKRFIDNLYDPSRSDYKRYLSPDQFTERFGASAADYQRVVDFAKSNGLIVTATAPNRMIVDIIGTASDFERIFHFTLRTYQHPSEPRQFHAPDVPPSVPAGMPILDLIGLDDYVLPHRMDTKPAAVHPDTTGSGLDGGFLAKDLRTAYIPGVSLTGAGQSIGLLEFGPYSAADISAYEQVTGLPNPPLVNILLDGLNGVWTPGYGDGEEAIDVEMAIAMAPGAQILVYEGNSGVNIMNRMATDNAARQLSCSWGFGYSSTLEQILMQYAAQGQTFLQSSGDGGTWTTPINAPGGDPYTTEVGGTSLVTNGPGGAWVSESTWKGSGGGVDTSYPIPSWQAPVSMVNNLGSTQFRNFPDVAMIGDTVIFAITGGHQGLAGGTSFSSPLWAGFVALANQQGSANLRPPVGFLNPTVYALGQSSHYNLDFHDITTGNNTNTASPNLYYAVPGYDLTTGWGTPTGLNLINDLAGGTATSQGFTLSVAPYQVTVNPGGSGSASVTLSPYGGLSGAVSLAISGLPAGVGAVFSPVSSANAVSSSTMTLSVPASVPLGSYTGTITASAGLVKQTIAMTLVVVAPIAADFTISASPSILNAIPGTNAQTAIAITPVGAFAGAVSLSVTGLPSGVTASFSPANTAASSAFALSVGSQVAPGIHILTIAASAGSMNHSSTIGLLVRASAQSPTAVDLSTIYNVTGLDPDGTPFLAGINDCCAYSANLLGQSLTLGQSVPFIYGPATNGLVPAWNAITGGSGKMTVQLPAGQYGSVQMLASGKGGNQPAQVFEVDYSDKTSDTFTQSVSDWSTPQNYSGEATAASTAYSYLNTGAKVNTTAYVYGYGFNLNPCKTASSFTLPANQNLATLALTLTVGSCDAVTVNTVNVVSGAAGISQNAWIEIHGLNLAPSSIPPGEITWSNAPEFAQGKMPTQLDGVSVTVNGNPAYVYYISQGQIDVLTPLDSKTGTVPVVVTNGTAVSATFNVNKMTVTPAFALSGATSYLAATHANGTYVGPTSAGPLFTPAAPGEEIVLYGFGFGLPASTGPALVQGSSTQTGTLPFLPTINIGGKAAAVMFAGIISPGLYQFNVVVPPAAASGDNAVTAAYNSVAISTAGMIPVQ